MPGDDDLKSHALSSAHDFYDLLGLAEGAQETEIRRAYRKTALKYHPDKVGANVEALEKFHLLQIAYDVLADPALKEVYDNARRARQLKAERNEAYEGKRKWMKEDLERREGEALKRKRGENEHDAEYAREIARLAADGKRRREERTEQLRQEALAMAKEDRKRRDGEDMRPLESVPVDGEDVPDIDRSIKFRFAQNENTAHIDKSSIISRWSRFGRVHDALLREKKIKAEGQKHRQAYITVVLVYESLAGVRAAMAAVSQTADGRSYFPELSIFEAISRAKGENHTPSTPVESTPATFVLPAQHIQQPPNSGSSKAGAMLDESLMNRLREAEKKRQERKVQREQAEAAIEAQ